jgi:Predicted membrane protein (DUF2306)
LERIHHDKLATLSLSPANSVFSWLVKAAILIGAGWLTLLTVSQALSGAWDSSDFPEALLIKALAWPTIFPIHMATGAFALLLAPAAIALAGRRWHRFVARIAAADVIVAALTAVPVALESPITTAAAAGFTTQAVVWLLLLGLGLRRIRRGDVAGHRACMLMMAAVTSGAMFFRVYLALWVAVEGYAYFKPFYSCDAWAAWLTPLVGMTVWLLLGRKPGLLSRRRTARLA